MLQRFIRVRRADFVITFRGHIHTETVLAAALETPGKLVLPFPASGGDSQTYWCWTANFFRRYSGSGR